jgi:hypothetical protein
LLLGGAQGIGKDSILEPVKRAVGHWNFSEASPQDMFEPFNKFKRCVILRISEGRDLGDDATLAAGLSVFVFERASDRRFGSVEPDDCILFPGAECGDYFKSWAIV